MNNQKKMIFSALCTVLIIAGSYAAVPLPGLVPIVLSNMFVLFAGLLLGPWWGLLSVVGYLLLGTAGLPVFAEGKGGFVQVIGPTGGYLVSYIPAAVLCGFISFKMKAGKATDIIAVICGFVVFFVIGVPWLKFHTGPEWTEALTAGLIPFIPGEIIKGAALIFLIRAVRPFAEKMNMGQ